MRIPENLLAEVIANEGELRTGPVSALGVLRLALDLKETREAAMMARLALMDGTFALSGCKRTPEQESFVKSARVAIAALKGGAK